MGDALSRLEAQSARAEAAEQQLQRSKLQLYRAEATRREVLPARKILFGRLRH